MESLYAPWRIQYILAPKSTAADASIFAQIANSTEDEANYVIARDRTCYAVMNTHPYTGGHLMVVPYKQVPDFQGLTDEDLGRNTARPEPEGAGGEALAWVPQCTPARVNFMASHPKLRCVAQN